MQVSSATIGIITELLDEVEEGEEIHAQNLNMAPYAVAQGGWQRQQQHADKHDNAGGRTLDMEFVDDDGYHGFHPGRWRRCQRGEQHQQEEQRSDDLAELAAAHAVKYLGQSLEHKPGAGLHGGLVAAGENEHCGNDHQAGQKGGDRVSKISIWETDFSILVSFFI